MVTTTCPIYRKNDKRRSVESNAKQKDQRIKRKAILSWEFLEAGIQDAATADRSAAALPEAVAPSLGLDGDGVLHWLLGVPRGIAGRWWRHVRRC